MAIRNVFVSPELEKFRSEVHVLLSTQVGGCVGCVCVCVGGEEEEVYVVCCLFVCMFVCLFVCLSVRGVARLLTLGGQERNISSFFLILLFSSFFL